MARRVLVVDDEAGVRRSIERVLSVAGFHVTAVPDGAQALARLDAEVFDLLIIDVYMPDMDGLGLMRELRSRNDRTPILAVSGGGDSPHALDPEGALAVARAFGAGVLPKPFTVDELLGAVSALLDD
jgi:two-component system response regulator MprA